MGLVGEVGASLVVDVVSSVGEVVSSVVDVGGSGSVGE